MPNYNIPRFCVRVYVVQLHEGDGGGECTWTKLIGTTLALNRAQELAQRTWEERRKRYAWKVGGLKRALNWKEENEGESWSAWKRDWEFQIVLVEMT